MLGEKKKEGGGGGKGVEGNFKKRIKREGGAEADRWRATSKKN